MGATRQGARSAEDAVGLEDSPATRGHKKKARTRRLLLDTALEVLAERGEGFSLLDVAGRAGVSHGTVYNYFADRDELIEALVADLVEGFAAQAAIDVAEPDPAARFAAITARLLAGTAARPEAVRVALRLEAAQRAILIDGPRAYLRQDLEDGHATGRFRDPPDEAVLDVIAGALLLAARRIVDGEATPAYREGVIRRLLQTLGLPADEAATLAARAVAGEP